jgi:hypothetical protein
MFQYNAYSNKNTFYISYNVPVTFRKIMKTIYI